MGSHNLPLLGPNKRDSLTIPKCSEPRSIFEQVALKGSREEEETKKDDETDMTVNVGRLKGI